MSEDGSGEVGSATDAPNGDEGDDCGEGLPADVVDRAERLTRQARSAVDDGAADAYREARQSLLADHGFRARVREDDDGDVLALYPADWIEDGLVQVDAVEDVDRGVERPLEGPGDAEAWEAVDEHNRAVARAVADEHGPVHGDNAAAFADFMSNHYARPVESATEEERQEFLTEYFPRNAWPTDDQRDAVADSVALTVELGASLSDSSR